MKVQLNSGTVYVDWRYKQMKLSYPGLDRKSVDITNLVVRDILGNVIQGVEVRRNVNDPENREKARYFSLQKLLATYYTGKENRENRTAFWNAFRNRKGTPAELLARHLKSLR